MPLTQLSPTSKMPHPDRTNSQESTDSMRKRVCKACDRCRLKKSKCDGAHPCSRCKADNAICVFGERKKSHDKIYPKGYVEMLEQQQAQLVSGLQEMYKRLNDASAWNGDRLAETNGQPLTHDILAALDLLEAKTDGSGEAEAFEEDCQKLQSKLIANGAGFAHRRGSISSDSDQSHQTYSRSESYSAPSLSKQTLIKENFNFSTPPSPQSIQSPIMHSRPNFPPNQPSPLQHNSPLNHGDPQLYQAGWAFPSAVSTTDTILDSAYPLQLNNASHNEMAWDDYSNYDMGVTAQALQLADATSKLDTSAIMMNNPVMDSMDLEFNQFIQIVT